MTTGREFNAYDYDNQAWTTGEPARLLRAAQLAEEIALIDSSDGERYLRFIGKQSKADALVVLRRSLAEVMR